MIFNVANKVNTEGSNVYDPLPILDIIDDIKKFDKHGDISNLFLKGYCFEFCKLLERNHPGGQIYWMEKKRHYLYKYKNKYYDITGVVKIPLNETVQEDKEY